MHFLACGLTVMSLWAGCLLVAIIFLSNVTAEGDAMITALYDAVRIPARYLFICCGLSSEFTV